MRSSLFWGLLEALCEYRGRREGLAQWMGSWGNAEGCVWIHKNRLVSVGWLQKLKILFPCVGEECDEGHIKKLHVFIIKMLRKANEEQGPQKCQDLGLFCKLDPRVLSIFWIVSESHFSFLCHTSVFSTFCLIWTFKKICLMYNLPLASEMCRCVIFEKQLVKCFLTGHGHRAQSPWEECFTRIRTVVIIRATSSGWVWTPSCYLLSYLTSLSLSFLLHHMKIVIILTSLGCWEDQMKQSVYCTQHNAWHMPSWLFLCRKEELFCIPFHGWPGGIFLFTKLPYI